ncbi:MAG: TonB-dependent receptor [Deltaproteobacteria bacterium]
MTAQTPQTWRHKAAAVLLASLCTVAPAVAGESGDNPFSQPERGPGFASELEFFKVESEVITSVSRHPQKLREAAAAIYVISADDIKRSGATTIADALRMVPGMDVASVDNNFVAVSARGFNGVFADKMLVMFDGHPVYTPLFGGTIWHEWNTFLPDIERIEVIRGPGGTQWGSNAVNGVINIITKNAEDTQGGLARATVGTNNRIGGEVRYGARTGNFNYRVFGRGNTDKGFGGNSGGKIDDENNEVRAGYRFDWDLGSGLRLMSSGEFYDNHLGNLSKTNFGTLEDPPSRYHTELFTSVFRLEKDFADGSQGHLQLSGDYIDRRVPFLGNLATKEKNFAVEIQHSKRVAPTHLLTWGSNLRRTSVKTIDGLVVFDLSSKDTLNVIGGFVQDEITLGPRTELTLGTKVENNTFSGTNLQPSIRIVQRIDTDSILWGAISRAVNTPSFGDMFLTVPPTFVTDGNAGNTIMLSYEAGYRGKLGTRASYDLAAFYSDYDGVASFSGKTMSGTGTSIVLDNEVEARAYGVEGVLDFAVSEDWTGELSVSYTDFRTSLVGGDSGTPPWKISLRQFVDINPRLSVVPTLHWVDQMVVDAPLTGTPSAVDSYLRLDLAVHYQYPDGGPTLSLIGQNISERTHEEFFSELLRPLSPITRTWLLRITQEF